VPHPSRRRWCVVTPVACGADDVGRVLFPTLKRRGSGNKTRWWWLRRYDGFVAGVGLFFFTHFPGNENDY
jgi:hypothetical protein